MNKCICGKLTDRNISTVKDKPVYQCEECKYKYPQKITGWHKNPKKYNKVNREYIAHACITSMACEDCGAIHDDSICMCMGLFTCLACGSKKQNNINTFSSKINTTTFVDTTSHTGIAINPNFDASNTIKTQNSKWDLRFLQLCQVISTWSKDPSTKVGACIADSKNRIISIGYNGFPRGVDDDSELLADRKEKYTRIVHAEANTLIFAAGRTEGSTIYTWPFMPCSGCAALLIQAGIKRVVSVSETEEKRERWGKMLEISKDMFRQANIEVKLYSPSELQRQAAV